MRWPSRLAAVNDSVESRWLRRATTSAPGCRRAQRRLCRGGRWSWSICVFRVLWRDERRFIAPLTAHRLCLSASSVESASFRDRPATEPFQVTSVTTVGQRLAARRDGALITALTVFERERTRGHARAAAIAFEHTAAQHPQVAVVRADQHSHTCLSAR